MKRIFLFAAINMTLVASWSQTPHLVKITGTKFPFDIMQQWIDVYTKAHPGVQFRLSKAIPLDSADLVIAAHSFRPGELKDDQEIIAVNRYAQLPIVNSKRSDLNVLQQKGFTQRDLKNIYFGQDKNELTNGFSYAANVYKRDKNVCASRSFAENVTGSQTDVAGALVSGDDKALSAAVRRDVNGISYNNLGLVYNLQTRKVADSIAIVPIDINENGKVDANEKIYATLDDVLNYLGTTNSNHVPQDNVNIVYDKKTVSKTALDFLDWVVKSGQQYNRSFGFLNLDKAVVEQESQQLNALVKEKKLARNN
jgi:phosphate transport system substrate-binding protein